MTDTYKIAGAVIAITSAHDAVHRLCREYRTTEDTDVAFRVRITQGDIDDERERSMQEDRFEGIPVRRFPDSYLETLAVYRRIAERMPAFDTILLHGSCVAADGAGYLFTARSGVGKSTHTRLWREMLGERAVMVNDDKPLIRLSEDGASACGTPWDGKHRLSANISVPLKAICILERAEENAIRPVSVSEAYPLLLQQTYRPADKEALAKTLALLDRLVSSVRLWRLGCNMDIEAARIAYDAMKG